MLFPFDTPDFRECKNCGRIPRFRSPDGAEITLDFKGKAPGRGAYLCPDPDCLKKAIRSRALERAFSAPIPQEIYDRLQEEMIAGDG